ncbi:N,N-dimethylformamidase beta subunit family domain-containing protein [Rhodoligotrophos defluvii]|uniref:N,N-dimethylformamidase beta subunit family domain-containing protein n=1 Tax=Rhodoligotrophos defluvii TaxID=2561934 RepID=UPI0010C9FCB6|nr:N,N-dimethylformamidase beta subunit family domain-containing protein [Rhodoligotrophos defluvii]
MTTPMNTRPRRIGPMHADESWLDRRWYEAPREDPAAPEVYTYTDAISYEAGDEVLFHSSTHAAEWSLEIIRDGLVPRSVHQAMVPGRFTPMPRDAYRAGCGWPVAYRWRIPEDMPSGFYRMVSRCERPDGSHFVQDHFFVVRPKPGQPTAKLLMLLPTATYEAYNDWGGANHYIGIDGPNGDQASPILSQLRPWTRGMVWHAPDSPRLCSPMRRFGQPPTYHMKEWTYAHGYGFFCHAAGWAQFDRHFAVWAEREGYAFDMITQTDLHYRPELLDAYPALVVVGHDEYWSREMRLAVEAYVERGGRFARFGANFTWQIRLEDEGRSQVCYKTRAPVEDPVRDGPNRQLLSTAWEDHRVAWPGASTVGVNGLGGVYASWGGFVPRGNRGFTVYRPEHWIFAGTDLSYGDVFGAEAEIFAYEVDGVDYTFRDGLPYPTGADGTPKEVEILAMSPAVLTEGDFRIEAFRHYIGNNDQVQKAEMVYGEVSPETMAKSRYGAGMMVHMPRGKGEVLTAATCEWVMGLARNEPFTQQITRNVLNRFCGSE